MKTMWALALTLATAGLAVSQDPPIKSPATDPSAATQIVTTVSDPDLRSILAGLPLQGKVSIQEEKDSDGLTAFYVYENDTILMALYQYVEPGSNVVSSLGLSVGNRLPRAADGRKINEWNSSKRFVKAYTDNEGDAILSADMLLTPGVTKNNIREWLRMFAQFSREFTTFLKN